MDKASRDQSPTTCRGDGLSAATGDAGEELMGEVNKEPCEYCDAGWCEGRPEPTPNGPYYPSFRCTACDGHGWVEVEREAFTEEDAIDRDAALAVMGEDEDSLMLGGCGGGERDPDLEWY